MIYSHLLSQFTENNFCNMVEFCETPYAEILQNGIGNFGFDNCNQIYNPSFSNEFDRFMLNIGNNIDVSSNRSGSYNLEHSDITQIDYYNESQISKIPNLSLAFKKGNYQFQINHRCTKKLNAISKKKEYGYYYQNIQLNNLIQISLSREFIGNSSISIGALTNSYKYAHYFYSSFGDVDKMEVSTSYLDQFQYFISYNRVYNQKLKSYIYFKTQNTKIKLSPKSFDEYSDNNSMVSFPGIICLGVQYQFFQNIKVSFESLNDFIFTNEKLSYYDSMNDNTIAFNYKHKIFNPKISFGTNMKLTNKFSIGCLYTKYLKYDMEIYSLQNHHPKRSYYKYNKPSFLNFSIQYHFNNFNFIINYQYSSSRLEYNCYEEYVGNLNGTGKFKNESQFLSLDIYYFR